MRIRVHKNSFDESWKTLTEIEPTKEAIAQYLRDQWGGLGWGVNPKNITVEPYWGDDVYIVLLDGTTAAFTDGPLK